jgi:hypothetical protein
MRQTLTRRQRGPRLLASGLAAAVLGVVVVAHGAAQTAPTALPCPVTPAELSTIVGKAVQRVNLSGPDASPSTQCSFSAVAKGSGRLLSPQVYLTVDRGSAADLRELYLYYVQTRSKLATRPRVTLRPDLGSGAFTLTTTALPVTTAFFPIGKNVVATLSVDLADAAVAKRDQGAAADKILALFSDRLAPS